MNNFLMIFIANLVLINTSVADHKGPTFIEKESRHFSAEIINEELYITVNLDTCNNHRMSLEISSNCTIKNQNSNDSTCSIFFSISSTRHFCESMNVKNKVYKFPIYNFLENEYLEKISINTWGEDEPLIININPIHL